MEKEKIRTTAKSHRITSTPPQSQIPAQGNKVGTTSSSSLIKTSNLVKPYNMRQAKSACVMQRKIGNARMGRMLSPEPIQRRENTSGLPDNLKSGIENLSGYSMDDVKVHYNSAKPTRLHALAYAQGTEIHVAPGQEKHLPHEAWHVVQQKQGRVKPTMQMKGNVDINNDVGLEKEADVMGGKASRENFLSLSSNFADKRLNPIHQRTPSSKVDLVRISLSEGRKPVQRLPLVGNTATDLVIGTATTVASSIQWLSGAGPRVDYFPVLSSAGFGTGMTAVLQGAPPLPGGAAANLAPANPAWTALTKKKTVGGGAFYARLHLLRERFGGPAIWENLVPMTSRANNPSPLSHLHTVENQIEAALNGGMTVGYRVTPVYGSLGLSLPRDIVNSVVGLIPGGWARELRDILYYESMIPTAMVTSWWDHNAWLAVPSIRVIRNWAVPGEASYRLNVAVGVTRPLTFDEWMLIGCVEVLKLVLSLTRPATLWGQFASLLSRLPFANMLPTVLNQETIQPLIDLLEGYPRVAVVLHNMLPDLTRDAYRRSIPGRLGGFVPQLGEAIAIGSRIMG